MGVLRLTGTPSTPTCSPPEHPDIEKRESRVKMEEQWREAQRRMNARKEEHRRRLNTPALYAIEVYCQVFTLDGVSPDDFEDDDIRIRYKFLDYACVEMEKATGESGVTSTTTSSPWSSTPMTPDSPAIPSTPEAGTPGGLEGSALETPDKVDQTSMRSQQQNLKTGSDKTATSQLQSEENAATDGQNGTTADSSAAPSESASSTTQPSPSIKKRQQKRDPRYFDPKKLLKQNLPPPELYAGEAAPTDQPTGADGQSEAVTSLTAEPSKTGELKTDNTKAAAYGDGSNADLTTSKTGNGEQKLLDADVADGQMADSAAAAGQTAGPDSTITDDPDDTTIPPTEQVMTEYEEDFGEELTSGAMEDRSNALYFENGKSLIFCTTPLNLLYSLPRYPLLVIFFRPPSDVIGIARVDLSGFAEGVDSSIILTKSIPLSAERSSTFDIVSGRRTVGWADLNVRLSCFGPFLMHKIFVSDNPNEKGNPEARTRRTSSNRLIVVQMSVANLGLVRHKSKLFVSKSNPSLVGRVSRDISNLPPIVCADEHLISAPPRPKPELTIVEEEEMAKERKKRESLGRFPQYTCIDDWEVVFNRQVIKDLIAKNRRPFQPGSPDRIYVESYFPELLPDPLQRSKFKSESGSQKGKELAKKRKLTRKSSGDGPSLTYLDLDEAWLKDNNLHRIRRKSVRPTVRTSIAEEADDRPTKSSPSGASSGSKLPVHTMPSMSHVAVNHFDMEKNDFSTDSRVLPPDRVGHSRSPSSYGRYSPPNEYRADLKNASNVAMFNFNPFKKPAAIQQKRPSLDATSSRQFRAGQVFNTRHPRVDSNLEKFNPIPGRPYAIEIRAPERSPTDRLVQAIRQIGDEVDAIGGDTKMLHSMYQDYISGEGSERYIPDHMKRGQRTTQTPDETSRVLSGTVEPVLIEVDKGVPLAVPARGTPYWEGHAPVCSDPTNCPHFIFLHPGFGYYGR